MNKKDKLKKKMQENNLSHDSKDIHDALKKHKETKSSDEVLAATPKPVKVPIPMLDIVLYSLVPLLVVAIGFVVYLYTAKKEKSVQYISKPVEVMVKQELKFDNLPNDIKNKYILKSQYEEDIKKVKLESKPIVKDKIIKDKVNSQDLVVYNSSNKSDIVFKNSSEAKDMLKCYDMKSLKSDLSQSCQKNLKEFILKNKDIKYYEIVGIVSADDIDDETNIKKYKNLIYAGLAQKRANEMAWFMRKIIGQKPIIRVINYPVLSKKSNKGAIVRIYD
jgi:hypothetical protein